MYQLLQEELFSESPSPRAGFDKDLQVADFFAEYSWSRHYWDLTEMYCFVLRATFEI